MTLKSAFSIPTFLMGPDVAFACPGCPSARLVRASIYDDAFWSNLTRTLLPLLVLGVVSAFLYRIGIQRSEARVR
jgi:hypothetical protein